MLNLNKTKFGLSLSKSLFRHIVLWYILSSTIVICVFTWMFYRELEHGRRVSFNVKLVAHSKFLASRLCHIDNDIDITYLSADTLSNNIFAVYDMKWSPLIVSIPWRKIHWNSNLINNVKLEKRAQRGKSCYGITKNNLNQAVRFCVTRAYLKPIPEILSPSKNYSSNSLPVNVVYAALYEPTLQYLGFRLHRLIISALILLVAIIIMGIIVAAFGTRPIIRLGNTAKKITPEDVKTRLPVKELPNELGFLAERINEAFDRLAAALVSEQKFTASAAHELRSPVAGLVARLDNLLSDTSTSNDVKEKIQKIHNDAEKLKKLSGQLLLLARLDRAAAGEKFKKTKVDLNEIVIDVIDFSASNAEQKNITINYISIGKVFIEANEEWLLRAVYNILDNAIKYSPPNSKITIKISIQNNCAVLSIKDEGIGIPIQERKKIFERFYQTPSTNKKMGTGIGLAIVFDIIKAHNGRIIVEDNPEGNGSVFTIILPGKNFAMNNNIY